MIPNRSEENLDECNYAEIVWRNGAYWFCYSIQVPEKDLSSHAFKVAGGDLGEIHAVTVATEDKALVRIRTCDAQYLSIPRKGISRFK